MKKNFKIIAVIFICVLLVGCGVKDDSSKYNIKIDAPKNIKLKAYISQNKDELIIDLVNKTKMDIGHFTINAIYYDKDGKKIDESVIYGWDFRKNSEYACSTFLPYNADRNQIIPEKTELVFKVDEDYQKLIKNKVKSYADKIETSYKKDGENIVLNIKNNANVDLYDVSLGIMYMKKGRPIYFEDIYNSIEAGKSITEETEIPYAKYDDDYKMIEYDDIKILVLKASSIN